MTIVEGKVESLKKLKENLHKEGIYRFNSVGQIRTFQKQYISEKKAIPDEVRQTTDEEILNLKEEIRKTIKLRDKNFFNKVFYYLRNRRLIKNHDKIVNDYEAVLSRRCEESYRNLEFIKETVDGLYSTIAGAVGETKVVNELKKLSDKYYLINDFSLNFNPPIFNKRENYRIFSIQIDHLLICQSGLFILETKNWSKQSIENFDLRSPVEQIKRANYGLFVFLNSGKNEGVLRNHWGRKTIPIKNLIVMTNDAPKNDFQYVKVLPLHKLNGYVSYFEPKFDKSEVERIFNALKMSVDCYR